MATTATASLSATQWMSHGVLRSSSNMRPTSAMTRTSRFSPTEILMVDIPDLSDRRATIRTNFTHLAGGQRHDRPLLGSRQKAGGRAGTAGQLSALAEVHLDIVNVHAGGDIPQRHGVAHLRFDPLSAVHNVSGSKADRRENVTFLSVRVRHKGNMTGTVGIVLDRLHCPLNAIFVALEVDPAVDPTSAAASVPHRDAPVMITPAVFGDTFTKRLFRAPMLVGQLGEIINR
jgi:hypothetical protein